MAVAVVEVEVEVEVGGWGGGGGAAWLVQWHTGVSAPYTLATSHWLSQPRKTPREKPGKPSSFVQTSPVSSA
jgi:hypothetical protein